MASARGRETPPTATFGRFLKNRRFGLHFAGGMGQKFGKKNISREASGDVWGGLSMPNGLPRALRTRRKKITNKSKFSGRVGEAWGRSVGHLGYHRTLYRRIQPSKNHFFRNSNFDKSIKMRTQRGKTDPDLFDFRGLSL